MDGITSSRFYTYFDQKWGEDIYKRFLKLIKLDDRMKVIRVRKDGTKYEDKRSDRSSYAVRKLIESYVKKFEPIVLQNIDDKKNANIKEVSKEDEEDG